MISECINLLQLPYSLRGFAEEPLHEQTALWNMLKTD
jgi:hypothetical protein